MAKKGDLKRIIIVEGYMDAISLHQRGISYAVASLGTAMTEAQGRLLRKSSQQVIIGYDSDGAGQAATMRGLEILQGLGCDVRILQIEGAKDPDEFVIKYGPERFEKQVDKAISLVEYKVKVLKNTLNIEHPNDKIKFLKEIAKVLSKIDNEIEREVYAQKISSEYQVSKEAIYAEISKLENTSVTNKRVLESAKPRLQVKEESKVEEQVLKREKLIIYLLINYPEESYNRIKNVIRVEDIKDETNKQIIKKLYDELEKGNSNTSNVLDWFEEEKIINEISWILAYDFEITEVEKCIDDILGIYEKEKVIQERNDIINQLDSEGLTKEQIDVLESRLNEIIIQLAKMK